MGHQSNEWAPATKGFSDLPEPTQTLPTYHTKAYNGLHLPKSTFKIKLVIERSQVTFAIWKGSGTKTTWLGLGKFYRLPLNNYLLKQSMWTIGLHGNQTPAPPGSCS